MCNTVHDVYQEFEYKVHHNQETNYWFTTISDITSLNNSTIIGGTIRGSSTSPSLDSITNNTYLEKISLTIA